MLDTLYKIGQQLSQQSREEFDDIILKPPIDETELEKGVQFLVVEVIFDLDNQEIRPGRKRPFDADDPIFEFSPYKLRCLRIQGGNNKSIYPTVDPRKSFDPWVKTFFGKDETATKPELVVAIEKDFSELREKLFFKIAEKIIELQPAFKLLFYFPKEGLEELVMDHKKGLKELFGLTDKDRVAMLTASIVAKDFGLDSPTVFAQLDGFDDFLRRKFLKAAVEGATDERAAKNPRLCYVSGKMAAEVSEPEFAGVRYSINKMFVMETKNYATGFDGNQFIKNYQGSDDSLLFLERGSKFLLANYVVQIAGINHCIIPQFRAEKEINIENLLSRLKSKSELLFSMSTDRAKWDGLIDDIHYVAGEDIYWITFFGYDSNGNFFKGLNRIEDISKTHFETVTRLLSQTHREMEVIEGIQWANVMAYGKEKKPGQFNFYTIYSFIPIRKDKGKHNAALDIFKAILERRHIQSDQIFEHFTELIQCHRFERYAGYNIFPNTNFDYAARDAVFQYHAFLQFLKKLKLLDMDEKTPQPATSTIPETEPDIIDFFEKMGYQKPQRKAMFYLGRLVYKVSFAQYAADHKHKPVLRKINYNGMDNGSIFRLYGDVFEKCTQYDIMNLENEGYSRNFTGNFNYDEWNMNPQEALFFLLAGYSFRTTKELEAIRKAIEKSKNKQAGKSETNTPDQN